MSRLPDGSSAKRTDGLLTSALAMATLCCSPPDSSDGLCDILSARPSSSRSRCASVLASFSGLPAIRAGIITFSVEVNSGRRWWNWKTKPIFLFLNAESLLLFSRDTSVPSMVNVPASGLDSVPSIWRSVDFPAPDAPMMDTTSAFAARKSIPLRTFSVPKDFSIPRASIIVSQFCCQI